MAVNNINTFEPIQIKFNKSFNVFNDNDLFNLCMENENFKIERTSNGELIFMSPVGIAGSSRENVISTELQIWNKEKKLGIVLNSSAGFTLANNAMRSPDAAFIKKESWQKLPEEEREKFGSICPEFIVEVRSKSDRLNILHDKMIEWIENGAELAWLIDPIEKKAYIYRPNSEVELMDSFEGTLSGESILPGFNFELSLLKENI